MTKVMTFLCCLAFAISGVMLAITKHEASSNTGYKVLSAAPLPKMYNFGSPVTVQDTGTIDLSEDLVRDIARRKGVLDTVYFTKTDTIKEQVTKVKIKKVPVPSNVIEVNVSPTQRDTVRIPIYYLAKQVGNKEGPTGECISIYEIKEVDKICPETNIPCVDNDVGD